MTKPSGPKHLKAFRDNYLAAFGVAAFLLLSICAQSQILTKPNNSYGTISNRNSPDSTDYTVTGCGVPHDTASLFSVGFGQGQKLKKAAFYYDSCGHHLYWYDPTIKDWYTIKKLTDTSLLVGGDTVAIAGAYIKNQTAVVQPASFKIDGTGTFKGDLSQFILNNTNPSLAPSAPLFELQFGDTSAFTVSKTGTVIHRPTASGTAWKTRLANNQILSAPVFQIQDSSSTPILDINTNSKYNLFLGVGVGIVDTKPTSEFSLGSSNTGVGFMALALNTDGNVNTAVGARALGKNTTGNLQTAVGENSLASTTTGVNNTAIGQASATFNTTGSFLVAVGQNALRNNTTGANNTGVGIDALWNNSTGTNNVAIGAFALARPGQSTIYNMSQNVGIGYNAGFSANLGINNVIVGYNSHNTSTLGDGNTLIGANQTASGTAANISLFGQGVSSSVSNISLLSRGDQNAVIGISAVSSDNGAKLQVAGNVSTSVIVSSAGSLTLDNSGATFVFSGTTTTWSLPAVAGHTGWYYRIKNRGTGTITLQAVGGDSIYTTTSVTSVTLNPGDAATLDNDGTYWLFE